MTDRAGGVVVEGSDKSRFRGDIEGMRAIAVLLVLAFHAGVAVLPGGFVGVDVFFVISGFLITTLLVRELREHGSISLVGFYGRRAKRLLPAAATVLIAVALLSYLILPAIRWPDIANDVLLSTVYGQNWRLANDSVDYLGQNEAPSPLQHFWSLAIEEQFYIFWPALLLVVTLYARRRRQYAHGLLRGRARRDRNLTPFLLVALALVIVSSLTFSIVYTNRNPGEAYFVTTTRVWELAVGAAVAVLAAHLTAMPRVLAAVLGWVGIAVVVASAFLIDSSTPFPGVAALAPVLGAAAVIASGVAAGRVGPGIVLGVPPMRWIGKLSYSLYLWHWPLIVIATYQLDGLTLTEGLLVVVLSFIPAYLSFRFIEEPARRARSFTEHPAKAVQFGLGLTAAGVAAGFALGSFSGPPAPPAAATSRPILGVAGEDMRAAHAPQIGAMVLPKSPRGATIAEPVDRVDAITPNPLQARSDFTDCRAADTTSAELNVCTWGPEDSEVRVAVIGDSHIQQWLPAITPLASERDWRVIAYTKASCPFTAAVVEYDGKPYESCTAWNRNVQERLAEEEFDLVITSNLTRPTIGVDGEFLQPGDPGPDGLAAGFRKAWAPLVRADVPIVVIRDTPAPRFDMAECVSDNLDSLTECAGDRDEWLADRGEGQFQAVEGTSGVRLVDLNDAICPTEVCAPVIGGVLVYRDTDHLTGTYAYSLAPRLIRAVDTVLKELGGVDR